MADIMEFRNMVRKGTVQKVDKEKMRARVKFGGKGGINSGELHILASTCMCSVTGLEGHAHPGCLGAWLPDIGEMVLCLMIPNGDGEGYILGGIR